MEKIIGIYDANSGFVGEFEYIFKKLFYKKHCALCDITHGFSFSAKKEWLSIVDKFPIPIETLHLNELDKSLKDIVINKTPCVVYMNGKEKIILIEKEELNSCQNNPKKFFDLLSSKLNIEK